MKEAIKYNYNIMDLYLYEIDKGYYFYYEEEKYYLYKYEKDVSILISLDNITKSINNKYKMNSIVRTKDKKLYMEYSSDNYVLLKVNDIENEEVSLEELLTFDNILIKYNALIRWDKMWENKIDMLEEELKTYDDDFPLIEEIIDYYIALSENAISYFIDTMNEENLKAVKVNINHKRIPLNIKKGFLINPLNIVIDYEVRDIAEYLKTKAINKINVIDDIYYIRSLKLSTASIRMLYSRLLYPSYFIDELIKVITNEKEENELKKYIENIKYYESFLKEFYNIISEKVSIPKIEWLYN